MFSRERIERLNAERLAKVQPELAARCRALIALAASDGFSLVVTHGFRSFEEQNRLYEIGRRGVRGEKPVTNARGGESNHNRGAAVDFAFVVGGEISWDERLYGRIGRWAAQAGLKWGGNWRKFVDKCHVEL